MKMRSRIIKRNGLILIFLELQRKNENILNLVHKRMPIIFSNTVKIYLKYETELSLKLILLE
jgi:hypothetical protein